MAVVNNDVKLYESEYMPSSEASTAGGGVTANEITGLSVGEVFPTQAADVFGGSDRIHYQKVFVTNNNVTDNLSNARCYLEDSLDDVAANGVVAAQSTSASDSSAKHIKAIGFDAASNPQTENITLNGTASVNGLLTFSDLRKVELYQGVNLTTASGNISLSVTGTYIGMIPAGLKSATGELSFGVASTLNDTLSTTSTLIPFAGIAFTKPNLDSLATTFANTATLTATASQGIFLKQEIKAGTYSSAEVGGFLRVKGDS